jgi:3-methyladenine DNA glycosylase AlkC
MAAGRLSTPMADALKTFFSPALVRRLARTIARVHPAFPAPRFIRAASTGLDDLELLDRGRHIGRVLAAHLPDSYPDAVDVLVRSLGDEHATDELLGAGMAPFFYMPHLVIVAERGLDHFEVSMRAQYEITKRFSAEFSIRPFIANDPERTLALLQAWARDGNAHVRRLVSEGTRLRLPWGQRVGWLDAHPERVLALLELLKDDSSPMVRRSVANNLNDLGKVYPDLLVRTATAWLTGASDERRALIEHALRGAVKRGQPDALALLGYGTRAAVALERVAFTPSRVHIGDRVRIRFTLRSTARRAQSLLVDLAVHFVAARGRTSPRVFKLTRLTLAPGATVDLQAGVSLAVHTTRVPRPGRHAVDVMINGQRFPAGAFMVLEPRADAITRRSQGARTSAPRETSPRGSSRARRDPR